MKKFLFLLLIPLLLFIPSNTFAQSTDITIVPTAIAYFRYSYGSEIQGSATSYATGEQMPVYPLHFTGNAAFTIMEHNILQFAFNSPQTYTSLKAYHFSVAFNYAFDGLMKIYDTEYLNGGLFANGSKSNIELKELEIITSTDPSNNRIIIQGDIYLVDPVDVSTWMVELSAGPAGQDGSGALGVCNSNAGTGLPVCPKTIVSQLSLLALEIEPITDKTDAQLNNIINNQKVTNEKLDAMIDEIGDVKKAITSEEGPNLDALEDSAGWLPPGPVDSILNLPLSLFNNLSSALSNTCQPVQATLPFINTAITLPCISSLYEQIGIQSFLNWVGVVVGCIILYNYFIALYKWVDDTLTFRENTMPDWGGV